MEKVALTVTTHDAKIMPSPSVVLLGLAVLMNTFLKDGQNNYFEDLMDPFLESNYWLRWLPT